jgi:hypothetical protein
MSQGELQQRLVGDEPVEDACTRLVRVASLVLVLIVRDIEPPGDATDGVGLDQTGCDGRCPEHGLLVRDRHAVCLAGMPHPAVLEQDQPVPDRWPVRGVENSCPYGDPV